ncbi:MULTISPECIES: ferredoxin [Streptomyces]|uniref:Ferredoxin n=1 Tax=Streptomyces sudanensis TaxID=436397 RepID=A0ABY4THT1_9ACTN|nr:MULTISPECIES: ferredoxin [Streptomyces]URN18465.1 ferredoxin [Streptomyces sudanensis]
MVWRVGVDSGACMGSGICAALAPDLFRLEGTYAEPVRTEIPEDERALDAADSCPALAIVVRDGPTTVGPRP